MNWDIRLPGASVLGVALPLVYGALAVMSAALPPRLSPGSMLALAALMLWLVWWLWAYPSATYRNGEFVIRNPLKTAWFTASNEVTVIGAGAPRFRHGSRSIRPVVMLVSPGGAMDTMRAAQGVTRGVNVVPMATLSPGHEAHEGRMASVLEAVLTRAGDTAANYRESWNWPGIAFTVALIAWTLTTIWSA